jgi:endonuclease/exonuclease/phosphatase family metal-dependent hydrolase
MGLAVNSRGASGGICTLWQPRQFQLIASEETIHSLLVKLVHINSGKHFTIISIYMPNQYHEKLACWKSLIALSEFETLNNLILVGDFNTTMYH